MESGCKNSSQVLTTSKNSSIDYITPSNHFKKLGIKVEDRVFFNYDTSIVSYTAKSILDKQAKLMKNNPYLNFILEGYCDKRGTVEYNLALAERRANSVKNYLINSGINPSRLMIISYGKEKPSVIGNTEEIYKQNRRVVTVTR